ncbi:gliding motility-associated C-terminal domain-containing protein [Hymenobacter properus]|uniref:Gliding motility-associated C-terminal domain-containing protein n=1 Tax=Hymenobacter properus TaxID=2791026 RepID=A0A931FI76_9BACT|nr:gliding motility-associated C-terminal domain-containing protein [Hymenobacter properus]MBF9141762.1 gliding motility-associated C-terminal domain-containing protein [Hymenobacter properus]MBR7720571.1 gliding motility-associated C-terminal domain-containing protein [Microvirga sp. SRT04]
MRTKITHLALLFALLGPGALRTARAQTVYVPAAVTGFTDDVVAEGPNSNVAATTTNSVDRGIPTVRWCFASSTFPGLNASNALPANGTINSISTTGLTFQLASYTGPNSLRIDGDNRANPATLTLTNPQPCSEVMVLATEGNGTTAADKIFRVNFTDGTNQTFNGVTVPDWFNGTITPAINVGSRVSYVTNAIDITPNNPRLYEVRLNLSVANYSKSVQSITVIKSVVDPVLNVMAISLGSNCLGVPTGGTAIANPASVCPGQQVVLGLTGASATGGITYQWQASTDGGTTYNNIAGATSTFYTVTPSVTTRYRAVVTCRLQSSNSSAVTVTVPPASATVVYPTGPYCQGNAGGPAQTVVPTSFTPAGGTFTSGAGLVLDATTGAVNLTASTPGTYTVTYTIPNSCQAVASTSITLVRAVASLAYPASTYCRVGSSGAPTFQPAGGTFTATPAGLALNASTGLIDIGNSTAGTYTVSYTSSGACPATATTSLTVKSDAVPQFPNVITPNGDDQNEELKLRISDVTGYRLRVFNRWGRKVYESNDATKGWKAEDNSAGMYYYQVEYTDCAGRRQESKTWIEVIK